MSDEVASSYDEFEWYKAGKWATIEQGDFLSECPVLVPSEDLATVLLQATEGKEISSNYNLRLANLIVVTQSCDLLKKEVTQVLLCSHFPTDGYGQEMLESIRKEHRPNLHLIEACEIEQHKSEQRIVDFRTVYTLPKDFVTAFLNKQPSRLRLLPPYREHLAQAFARYFMRVGLPRNLKH